MKLYLLLIGIALLSVPATAQPRQDAKTWAVVIGISRYQKLPGGQQLQFAAHDATTFTEAIQKKGVSVQNVRLLTGSEATAAAIKSAIGTWLARAASESDTVLIFFSGHGLFEREFRESYLLAYDSDPKDPYGTAVSIGDLTQALNRRVRSGRVLVIADAVRRDFFDPESDANSATSFEQGFDQLAASRPGISTILASGPGEFSREGERWGGRGVFTKHLVDVLFDGADKNGNLAVTTAELFDLLKGRVSDDTSGKQHPWRSGTPTAQRDVARVERENPPTVTKPSTPLEPTKPLDARAQVQQSPQPNPTIQPPKQVIEAKTERPTDVKVEDKIKVTEQKPGQPAVNNPKNQSPPIVSSTERKAEIASNAREKRPEPVVHSVIEKKTEIVSTNVPNAAPKPEVTPGNAAPKAAPPAENPPPRASATPAPGAARINSSETTPPKEAVRSEAAAKPPAVPKPVLNPPSAVAVSSDRSINQPEAITASVPTSRSEAAPLPLVLQLETAMASNKLMEPKGSSAWEYYQRLASDPAGSADAARLKPLLAEALATQGRAIVSGDVRSDNVSEKVDDFKRAGQMLARARMLAPDNRDASALEKLSAAEALVALQFYDEAERALAPLASTKLAAVDNALGLLYQGRLDTFRAERAFKRAIEIDSKWAAPHYNLAMLYRGQQNQSALVELEVAASLEPANVNLIGALGEEYFTRQQWKQAGEAFRKAIALKPTDDNLHTKLGHALYSQGMQEEANREYQKARELRPKQ
jgi:tetratricopeptide (TPR) repeat protein/uncharacterized caspase-like protein